jgi:hypothetical protein
LGSFPAGKIGNKLQKFSQHSLTGVGEVALCSTYFNKPRKKKRCNFKGIIDLREMNGSVLGRELQGCK